MLIFRAFAFAVTGLALCASSAYAAKASKVADLHGAAYVVRCNPEGTWAATWATTPKGGGYTLYVIDTAKGDKRQVDTCPDPGGLCWIPNRNVLYYCKGKPVSSQIAGKFTSVTYFIYDVAKGTSKKVPGADLKDQLDTYIIDPVAAEDGSKIFHMTIDRDLPSFNIYFPGSNLISPMYVKAKVAADYDLSSDGQTLYWPMTEQSGKLIIAGWGFKKNYYSGLYEIKKDPATGRAGFKVDSTNKQAVTMASSSTDSALKAVVYSFKDPKTPQAIPVKLNPNEDIVMLDWKGRTGLLYILVGREANDKRLYSVIELNPATGGRTVVLPDSSDEIQFVDYASRSGAYFYAAVIPNKGSRIVKVQ
ncbi:MAG: hypothetical protein M3R04_07160 [bacterium]|nr:hypothetical protein [bacterium]